jgi:hypothetical protein
MNINELLKADLKNSVEIFKDKIVFNEIEEVKKHA